MSNWKVKCILSPDVGCPRPVQFKWSAQGYPESSRFNHSKVHISYAAIIEVSLLSPLTVTL